VSEFVRRAPSVMSLERSYEFFRPAKAVPGLCYSSRDVPPKCQTADYVIKVKQLTVHTTYIADHMLDMETTTKSLSSCCIEY
jgi:hypothetical protein